MINGLSKEHTTTNVCTKGDAAIIKTPQEIQPYARRKLVTEHKPGLLRLDTRERKASEKMLTKRRSGEHEVRLLCADTSLPKFKSFVYNKCLGSVLILRVNF